MVETEKVHILVVDDDDATRRYLASLLNLGGYAAATAATGAEALAAARDVHPDVILLDIGLPDADGVILSKQMGQIIDAAVIFVTGHGTEMGTVLALDAGGDDYVVKPFHGSELLARIRAVLRRRQRNAPPSNALAIQGIEIDERRRRLVVHGTPVDVTPREYALLHVLMSASGRVVSRTELIDAAWGAGFDRNTNALDVHIRNLRKKIEEDPSNPRHIRTVRGVGFFFAVD